MSLKILIFTGLGLGIIGGVAYIVKSKVDNAVDKVSKTAENISEVAETVNEVLKVPGKIIRTAKHAFSGIPFPSKSNIIHDEI